MKVSSEITKCTLSRLFYCFVTKILLFDYCCHIVVDCMIVCLRCCDDKLRLFNDCKTINYDVNILVDCDHLIDFLIEKTVSFLLVKIFLFFYLSAFCTWIDELMNKEKIKRAKRHNRDRIEYVTLRNFSRYSISRLTFTIFKAQLNQAAIFENVFLTQFNSSCVVNSWQ